MRNQARQTCWRGTVLLGILLASLQGCAAARPASQLSDLSRRLPRGSTVYVTDVTRHETKGRIDDVSRAALTLDVNGTRQVFTVGTIRQIERYGDSLWNGIAIGAGIGAASALISDPQYRPCHNRPAVLCADAQIPQRVLMIGVMGAAGAGIDALYRRRHLVYQAPNQTSKCAMRLLILPVSGHLTVNVVVELDLTRR
jgi:hypothetical protein